MWEELLGIRPIGIDDNFFELGGHSLLAVQMMFRVRGSMQVELSPHNLYDEPTIKHLASFVAEARRARALEEQKIAQVYAQVAALSDEEVERLLSSESMS